MITETFACALIPNHFHFLIRIKGDEIFINIKPANLSLQFSIVIMRTNILKANSINTVVICLIDL